MDTQFTMFDQCRTQVEIPACLQGLVQELLFTGQTPAPVDLSILTSLAYSDLKDHPRPVPLLSEICRLLIKSGDQDSLRRCLALAHTLYAFSRQHQESRYLSYVYKGIAQIGLKMTDLGIKNVSLAIAPQQASGLAPVDQALGYWALLSAAIANRNLKLAAALAQKWHHAAQEGNVSGETFRAKLVIQLFHLLLGETAACRQHLQHLLNDPPEEWQAVVRLLEDWTTTVTEGQDVTTSDITEPYPLLLGVAWHGPASSSSPEDFSFLCELRRNFCNARLINTLSIEELQQYAQCLAHWELPRPLYDFETILKHKAVEKDLHYLMTRLLGKHLLESVMNKSPNEPEVVPLKDAIILVMDVRQYSALSEHRTPEEMFDLLNPVFKIMNEELEQAGGTILEFVGDCIIVAFNTFKGQPAEMPKILSQTIRCVRRIHILNAMSRHTGCPEIHVGIGINQGPVAVGYLGGLERCHVTVLGNTINLAARIESSTKELSGDVLVSEACFGGKLPDIWATPDSINYALRDLGCHQMRNIQQPVHLFGLRPLLQYWIDFVPMGFVAFPETGVVYIDTGNSTEFGVIDHHVGSQAAQSACELLNRQPELLLEHLKDVPATQIEFRLHTQPDLDCAATLYTAYEFLDQHPRKAILWKLAEYISQIDQGTTPHPERLSDSLKGIFRAHQKITAQRSPDHLSDFGLLEAGLRVIDAAVYLMEKTPNGDFAWIFQEQPEWFAEERRLLQADRVRYEEDLKLRSHTYTARVNGIAEPVGGLWLDHPQSIFFALFARSDPSAPGGQGYPFLTVDCSQPQKNRFIISVAPESGIHLKGLGQRLEQHEALKRKHLGQERPVEPIRYPSDNSDPWYFGQGHQYTIIDSPWEGTILTAEEVQNIHESWQACS